MKRHWPVLIVVLLAALAFRQSSIIHARGVELRDLEARLETLNGELAATSGSAPRSPATDTNNVDQLRQRAEPVHRLRGNVTMARKELELIQARVAQLAKQFEARSNQLAFARAPEFPEGYRQASTLQNAGQTFPEATLETFFHAVIAGNLEVAAPCFDELAGRTAMDADARQRTANEMKQMFGRFPGYQLVSREQLTPTKARLGIRTSPESRTIHIILELTDRKWVINANESELFK